MSKGKEEKIYDFEGIRKSEIISALRNHCTPIILLGKRNLLFHLFLPLNLDSESPPLPTWDLFEIPSSLHEMHLQTS